MYLEEDLLNMEDESEFEKELKRTRKETRKSLKRYFKMKKKLSVNENDNKIQSNVIA